MNNDTLRPILVFDLINVNAFGGIKCQASMQIKVVFCRKFSYDGGGSLDAYFWVRIAEREIIKHKKVSCAKEKGARILSGIFTPEKCLLRKVFSAKKREKVFSVGFSHQAGSDKQPSPKGQVVPYPAHEGFDR